VDDHRLTDDRAPIWKHVLQLAWPPLVQQLLVLSVTVSDRLLVGRFQHVDADVQIASQAAQTTTSYITWLLSSFTVLVTVGSSAVVARLIGGGDRDGAIRVVHQSLLLAAALGLVGGVLGLVGMPYVVRALQHDAEAAAFASAFLQPLLALFVCQMVEAAGIACLVGAGDTKPGLWVLGGVAVVNVPLAWAFFRGVGPFPGLGFVGIAVGTATTHALGAAAVVALLVRGRAGLRLRWELFVPDWAVQRRVLRLSVPAGADSLSIALGQLWFLGIVNRLGPVAGGAHGIALNWESLGYLSGGAFGTAAVAVVGQNLGAGRPDRAARGGWTAFALGGSFMSLMGAFFFLLAPQMFQLYCPDVDQAPIVAAGVPALRLVAFAMPALASCIIFTSALRGAGDARVPVLITWLGFFVVRIPLAYLLTGAGFGLLGAWLAMVADIAVRGGFFLWRFASGRWRFLHV
jgi:putative MATE family efflux protein